MKLLRLKITDPDGFRSLQAGFEHHFRTGHGETLGRSLGVKVQFGRLEDGLQHGQWVQVVDCQADADEVRAAGGARQRAALSKKRPERLGRDILGRIDREQLHGLAGAGGAGLGNSTREAATVTPASRLPQFSSSRQFPPGW